MYPAGVVLECGKTGRDNEGFIDDDEEGRVVAEGLLDVRLTGSGKVSCEYGCETWEGDGSSDAS